MNTTPTSGAPSVIPPDVLSELPSVVLSGELDGTFITGEGEQGDLNETGVPDVPIRSFVRACPETIGRYTLLRKLGEGGMGTVYQARHPQTNELVAIKLLSRMALAKGKAEDRFHKEVRLLKEVNNPYVANLIENGEEDGEPYLVMEYVSGPDLRQLLHMERAFEEAIALRVLADICRALLPAHAVGIIHRDIKPANVLLACEVWNWKSRTDSAPRVKLTDFGLARHIDQTESLQLTQTRAFLGTPYYMAPEQLTGSSELTPGVDVYALGITLFEFLTGRRPFEADDPMKLATLHCFTPPPSLRKLVPSLSDSVIAIVEKALAKEVHQRYPDAASMLCDIERLLRGETTNRTSQQMLPPHNPDRLVKGDWHWELDSSPGELWQHVCNTERVNQAMGLPGVRYERLRKPGRVPQLLGNFRLSGIPIQWEEHPFEWVEGRRMSILREFASGPFKWFLSTLTLAPRAGGGASLTHSCCIEPRGFLGRMLATREVGSRGRRALDRIYRRIDVTLKLQKSSDEIVDPFISVPELSRSGRTRMEQRLELLQQQGVAPRFLQSMRKVLSHSAPQDLARLRPIPFARRFGLSVDETLKGCLWGVKEGLLTMHWDVICPTCRISSSIQETLQELKNHAYCEACDLNFEVDFGKSLELMFRVHPEIRTADLKTYCAGGPAHFPHVVAQFQVVPHQRVEFDLNLCEGGYILRSQQLAYTIPLMVENRQGTTHADFHLSRQFDRRQVPLLKAGGQLLAISNEQFEEPLWLRIERTTPPDDIMTAAQVSSLELFRELFPDQVLSPGLLVHGAVHGFLAADLMNLEELYEKRGDSQTFSMIQALRKTVSFCIPTHRGAVVEVNEENLLAVFSDGADAVAAGLALHRLLMQSPETRDLKIRLAAHSGPTLVATDQNAIRYFGGQVTRVRRLPREGRSDWLLITRELAADPKVQEYLRDQNALPVPYPPEEFPENFDGHFVVSCPRS